MVKKAKKKKKKRPMTRGRGSGTSEVDQMFRDGVPSTGFSNLPPGTYEGYVKPGTALIEVKDSGGHRCQITLVVTSPEEFAGNKETDPREQVARYDLTTQVGVDILLGELETMELGQPDTLEEAGKMLAESDNIPVEFWVGVPKDEFPPKVRINARLEEDLTDEKAAKGGESKEPEYTKAEIKKMSDDELDDLAKEEGLDPDDYETYPELAKALIEELGL